MADWYLNGVQSLVMPLEILLLYFGGNYWVVIENVPVHVIKLLAENNKLRQNIKKQEFHPFWEFIDCLVGWWLNKFYCWEREYLYLIY